MGAFGEMLIRNLGGDLDEYRGDKPKKKEMKKEDLVGKEVYGFKFPNGKDNVCWNSDGEMDPFINMKGKIIHVDTNRVYIRFDNYSGFGRNWWWYPLSMVGENLVNPNSSEKTIQEIYEIL